MNWIDLTTNPIGLREIFHGDPPPLVGVSVFGVAVDREGPSLRVTLDLPDYPSDPPVKWKRSGFNTVQLGLLFGGVAELSLTGISTEVIADIAMKRAGSVLRLDLTSTVMRVSASAASVTVSEVTAYLNQGR